MCTVRLRLVTVALVLISLVALSAFLAAAQHRGSPPEGNYVAHRAADWRLDGPRAEQRRTAMLLRAQARVSDPDLSRLGALAGPLPDSDPQNGVVACRFLNDPPSGTTAKFNCVLDGGSVIKVKYGRNPEIRAGGVRRWVHGFPVGRHRAEVSCPGD
jgi:hypothetical protein